MAENTDESVAKVLELINENSVEYVDLRFTDPRGKWQHTAQHISTMGEDAFRDGIMFDGSSIAGWKAINESDMILMPDASTAVMDPFAAKPSLILFCDIFEPSTGQPYARDPRSTCKKAAAYVASSGIGDTVMCGAEAEFFIFDSVRFGTGPNYGSYHIDSIEGPDAGMKDYPEGNMGHRPVVKGGYFPVPPVDSESDLRAEMLSSMGEMGLPIEKHHHEVAQSQHELGTKFGELLTMADQMQIYKYCVHNVAHSYGKTATFMPKPIYGDNGSGMHTHLSIWKDGKPSFAGNGYADLSEMCLYFIGGIIKHAKACNAFTNPTTNSYKRLIPGFEAPVLLAYSARNRSASCRIPYTTSPKAKRVEVRFPDAMANPYLAYSALLMAGPRRHQEQDSPGRGHGQGPLRPAARGAEGHSDRLRQPSRGPGRLDADHDFLLAGDVFSIEQIQSYIELKWTEVYKFEHTPHPVEFQMYYSG